MKKNEIKKLIKESEIYYFAKINEKDFVAKKHLISKKDFAKNVAKKIRDKNYIMDFNISIVRDFEIKFNVEIEIIKSEFDFVKMDFDYKTKKLNQDWSTKPSDNFRRDFLILFKLENPKVFIKDLSFFEKTQRTI